MEDMMRANLLQEQVNHLQRQVEYWREMAEQRQAIIDQLRQEKKDG